MKKEIHKRKTKKRVVWDEIQEELYKEDYYTQKFEEDTYQLAQGYDY